MNKSVSVSDVQIFVILINGQKTLHSVNYESNQFFDSSVQVRIMWRAKLTLP